MGKNVSNYLQVTVPVSRIIDPTCESVKHRLDVATGIAGGVTRTNGLGEWLDDTGTVVQENVLIYRWYFPTAQAEELRTAVRNVVDRLLEVGEECVLRERFYSWREGQQFKAELIYK